MKNYMANASLIEKILNQCHNDVFCGQQEYNIDSQSKRFQDPSADDSAYLLEK